jgi:hypothetical protein
VTNAEIHAEDAASALRRRWASGEGSVDLDCE